MLLLTTHLSKAAEVFYLLILCGGGSACMREGYSVNVCMRLHVWSLEEGIECSVLYYPFCSLETVPATVELELDS